MNTEIHDEQDEINPEYPEHLCLISLGSNHGNPVANIQNAFDELKKLSSVPIRKSSLWKSAPVNCPPDSPDFIGALKIAANRNPIRSPTQNDLKRTAPT